MIENASRIPSEINTFFHDEYGKTLLIKGAPGSGKTVFALTLLSTLKGNGTYLSTSVDAETLYMQHPWIKGEISPDDIIDATQPGGRQKSALQEVTIKPLKYGNVPEFLKSVYIRTEKMANPVVIIDSWEAVSFHSSYYEHKDKEELEHNLCDVARRTKTKIILLVEYTGQTALDYLVDGVIVVESDMCEERRLRRMFMQKLRGCQITNPVRIFSLDKGMFKCFAEFKGAETAIANPTIPDPIPDLSETRISTGITDLDQVTTGYGGFNLFAGDHTTYDILARALSINALNLGRCLIFVSTTNTEDKSSAFVKLDYRGNIERVEDIKELRNRISIERGRSIVFINLEEIGDAESAVREVLSLIRKPGCVVMCFGGRSGSGSEEWDSFASTYIKTKYISGVPCIYGELPRTGIYALEQEECPPQIKLTPVV